MNSSSNFDLNPDADRNRDQNRGYQAQLEVEIDRELKALPEIPARDASLSRSRFSTASFSGSNLLKTGSTTTGTMMKSRNESGIDPA